MADPNNKRAQQLPQPIAAPPLAGRAAALARMNTSGQPIAQLPVAGSARPARDPFAGRAAALSRLGSKSAPSSVPGLPAADAASVQAIAELPQQRPPFAGRDTALSRLGSKSALGAPVAGADSAGDDDQGILAGIPYTSRSLSAFPNQPETTIAAQGNGAMPKNGFAADGTFAPKGEPRRMYGAPGKPTGPSYLDNVSGVLKMADEREAAESEARARQQLDHARSSASEGAIAEGNRLEDLGREAKIDSHSLRLGRGSKASNALMMKSLDLQVQAADIRAGIGTAGSEFMRTPEQEAGLAFSKRRGSALADLEGEQAIGAGIANQHARQRDTLVQRIAQLDPNDPTADTLRANLAALDGRDVRTEKSPLETFNNPVDETDAEGKPRRVQYGNYGTRRIVEGARPMPKQGSGVTVGPDGALIYSGGSPKLTEQQSRDLNYYTRGVSALKNMGDSQALADPVRKAGASVPLVGNALAGNEYQKAEQAGREFLASVLRKDSGAAVTPKELEVYGKTYLPQPFDSPETLKQKADARKTALAAIKLGMGQAQQLAPDDEAQGDPGPSLAEQVGEQAMAEGIARNKQRKRALRDSISDSLDQTPDYSSLWN